MKKVVFLFLSIFCCLLFLVFSYFRWFSTNKKVNVEKKFFNIVLIGPAGSGKGTQAELIKDRLNLLPISAGEVMRQYRRDEKAEYSQTITEYIDKGLLVPVEITNKIIGEHIRKNVFCDNCKYDGVIFDGYPRQMEQLTFLDDFLSKNNSKINAVIYIDIPMEKLIERLSGRFSCAKCGELYHKKTKPTKIEGICDKCGGTHFTVRADDSSEEAIKARFRIFEESTKAVLDKYATNVPLIKVDGTRNSADIAGEIIRELEKLKNDNK